MPLNPLKTTQNGTRSHQHAAKLLTCIILFLTFTSSMQATAKSGDKCQMLSEPGICMLGSKCSILKDGWRKDLVTANDIVSCGLGVYEQIVCCPYKLPTNMGSGPNIISTKTDTKPFSGAERPSITACRKYEENQSVNLTPLVLDGTPVQLREYPHMAAIGYTAIGGAENVYTFDCGGTLIASKFVLSAAHCVDDPRRIAKIVRMGVTNFTDTVQMRDSVEIAIELIHIHSEYTSASKYNDVAVLQLVSEVTFTARVHPTCLYTDMKDPSSREIYVAGWGTVDTDTRRTSDLLLKARLDITPLDACNASFVAYGLTRQIIDGIKNTQLCAYGGRKDSCYGDSGGPLVIVSDASKFQYRIVGIVSSGFSCGSSTPSLYTRVAAYLDFIEGIVWPNAIV